MKTPSLPEHQDKTIVRLERQLARERQVRKDAERIAEASTARLYREQMKLQAVSQVAAQAYVNDGLRVRKASEAALTALLRHTPWHYCRAVYLPFENTDQAIRVFARYEKEVVLPGEGEALTASTCQWLQDVHPLELVIDERVESTLRWPDSMPKRCRCSIGLGNQCFGALELFSHSDDDDNDYTRDMVLSLARELAHVYQSERDRRAMEQMAYQDNLTGIHNRTAFFRDLEAITIDTCQTALLYIDLDGFRDINDECGHDIGDRYLCEIAHRLEQEPLSQSVARLGSDEFVLLLTFPDDVMLPDDIVRELLQRLEQPIQLEHHRIEPSFSVGFAVYPDDASNGEALFHAADIALNRARENGGNTLRRFDSDIAGQIESRKQLAQQVRQAAANREFVPWFQPIVSNDHRIIGAEALLRWQTPNAPGPAAFIPLLESQGLMRDVGRQVLHSVIHTAARWRREGLHLEHVSVNVSPVQLREDAFVDHVMTALEESGLPPGCLVLEITESIYISAEKTVLECLSRLRSKGIRLALDDFGTGYSALSYLQWMPLDLLKIDKSFVLKLDGEPSHRDLTIVRAIIRIARACGLAVTAEGVESADVAHTMCALGAHYLQGYYFGRPIDEVGMKALLTPTRFESDASCA